MPQNTILVINTGSSSLKFGVYEGAGEPTLKLSGQADNIGHDTSLLELKDSGGQVLRSETATFDSESEAFDHARQWLAEANYSQFDAIGHRVVHGGPGLVSHQRITPALVAELTSCVHFAPLHIPLSLELIALSSATFPDTPQFACFDTAFHTTMPESAQRFPLPRQFFDQGIRRYGFHGLSYESIVHSLGPNLPPRTVVAHLGSGASLAALKNGRSVDTSMGLTPTGGIPMATRCGDLDPGILLFLMREKHMNADALEQLLNHDSGLRALSGSSDLREIEAAALRQDANAALALEIFCTAIRKQVAAYAAVLGGLDMLIFSGGIGEHSAQVRSVVCDGLAFLGIAIDDPANQTAHDQISTPHSQVHVRIVESQEDLQIARHCHALLQP